MVKVYQPKELAQLTVGLRLGELLDHLDFGCQRTDALLVHLMTKKLKGGSTQDTLGCVDLDTVILQAAEDFRRW